MDQVCITDFLEKRRDMRSQVPAQFSLRQKEGGTNSGRDMWQEECLFSRAKCCLQITQGPGDGVNKGVR
jgi:hypothetical protein